jgi:tetratricopeptide (TPR) repeat protein
LSGKLSLFLLCSLAVAQQRPPESDYATHNRAAKEWIHKARATGNASCYDEADKEIQTSFLLGPNNGEARLLEAQVLLGRKKYKEALANATAFNKDVPDEVLGYGLMADAQMALGDMDGAEKNIQWMLDLRRTNPEGLKRAGEFRALTGDVPGGLEMLDAAFQRTQPDDAEERAWITSEMARLQMTQGKLDDANRLGELALSLVPDYAPAVSTLRDVRNARAHH